MIRQLTLMLLFSIWISNITAQSLPKEINTFLTNEDKREAALASLVKKNLTADTIISILNELEFPKQDQKGIVISENLCLDGYTRPFGWYIPESYDPTVKTPLMIYLHGSVTHSKINSKTKESVEAYMNRSFILDLAKKQGFILLFPAGDIGAAWWDTVGITNVLEQIRITKTKFNIDDNSVFMMGFSDGASGSHYFAQNKPSDFAGFIPLNGHPTSGSAMSGKEGYFVNLSNSNLHVVNTFGDQLFADKKIRPIIQLAKSAGGNIFYRTYPGGHHFGYIDKEFPYINRFLNTNRRDAVQTSIKWETAFPETGRYLWFSIDKINKEAKPSEWYKDDNMDIVSKRVSFGFDFDEAYKGSGMHISTFLKENSFAEKLGIQVGDILTHINNKEVNNINDFYSYIFMAKGGDSTVVTLNRNKESLVLRGKFADSVTYKLFKRKVPSARAEVSFLGNSFYVKGSRLGAFTIYIHPDMVQLDQNVVIYVNDKKVFDEKVVPDISFMLNNFLTERDRELLYVNKIEINVKE